MAYTLNTPAFSLFVFVTDAVGASQSSLVIDGTITASCAGGTLPLAINAAGYLKLPIAVCTTDMTVKNSKTNEVIFTITPPLTLLYTA